ncbi:uncharacterized protein CANTADRAFT_315418 [Suhomyces tanzawaensis NRRL Y-17324]|uniref:Uncharacterized protein n=1 Tax=Suhomyces tanzawaensis NRRL Y-17324 TaxID=984487 RepID=A0A1E4SDG2_9ASCO|nr:uncharacterized protein CANTADRAFT_315418 [Suhomyces tanzawaensis NRRL Y-17324]ODV77554.1 hypothetical protein CANTADRAFT_315418 [Suhomyces tanzawaensis NRRL Y-17324]
MQFSELQPTASPSPVVLIIRWASKLSIEFFPSSECDVYIITNPKSFLSYIQKLVEPVEDLSIVTIFSGLENLVEALKFLAQFTSNESKYRTIYENNCRHHSKAYRLEESELPLVMSEGQYDLPLAFNLSIILDSKDLDDHLAAKSVVLQQYLRLIALKHGGLLLSLQDLSEVLKTPQKLFQFNPQAKPIYDSSQTVEQDGIDVVLNIPSGWDSWTKIILLAKSAIFQDNPSLMLDEKSLREANKTYDDYFEADGNLETLMEKVYGKIKVQEPKKLQDTLQFNDMLVQASM